MINFKFIALLCVFALSLSFSSLSAAETQRYVIVPSSEGTFLIDTETGASWGYSRTYSQWSYLKR